MDFFFSDLCLCLALMELADEEDDEDEEAGRFFFLDSVVWAGLDAGDLGWRLDDVGVCTGR